MRRSAFGSCDIVVVQVPLDTKKYEVSTVRIPEGSGRGWTLSLFSTAYIYDDRVEIVLPDNHTETFLLTEKGHRNRRGDTKRMELRAIDDGYLMIE